MVADLNQARQLASWAPPVQVAVAYAPKPPAPEPTQVVARGLRKGKPWL